MPLSRSNSYADMDCVVDLAYYCKDDQQRRITLAVGELKRRGTHIREALPQMLIAVLNNFRLFNQLNLLDKFIPAFIFNGEHFILYCCTFHNESNKVIYSMVQEVDVDKENGLESLQRCFLGLRSFFEKEFASIVYFSQARLKEFFGSYCFVVTSAV